ncbi:MAG: hypothetical protein V4590_09815 [Bacteroidota bacterium]
MKGPEPSHVQKVIACKINEMYFWVVGKQTTHLWLTIVLVIFWMAFSGCTKRYWFRVKIPGKPKDLHTVKVHLINNTPQYLSPFFEERFEQKVYQSLLKYGFVKTTKDTAEYNFTIVMSVEKVSARGISRFRTGNTTEEGSHEVEAASYRPARYGSHRYERKVDNINFRYTLEIPFRHQMLWTRNDYVYFKHKKLQDVNRSVSVLRLALRKKGEEDLVNRP